MTFLGGIVTESHLTRACVDQIHAELSKSPDFKIDYMHVTQLCNFVAMVSKSRTKKLFKVDFFEVLGNKVNHLQCVHFNSYGEAVSVASLKTTWYQQVGVFKQLA